MGAFFARIARACGATWAFLAALLGSVLAWTGAGVLLGFADSLLLIGNTALAIVSYLLLFVIQGSGNRDTAALQVKLDELLRAIATADDRLVGIEKEDRP